MSLTTIFREDQPDLREITIVIDNIDRKILNLLQHDATISVSEISHRVGLSQTPCWKRIQRLEMSGVILKRVALLAPEKLGLDLTAFVSVESADHSSEWQEQFANAVRDMPEIMEVHRVTGDIDYILRVVVPDIPSYIRFYDRLTAAVRIKNVTSRFAMERIKQSTAFDTRTPSLLKANSTGPLAESPGAHNDIPGNGRSSEK